MFNVINIYIKEYSVRIFKLIVEILLLINLSQPFVMAATCLIDPLTDPESF